MTDTTELTDSQRLAAPFEETFHDNRGGVDLEYITGEQVISRLNDVLGVFGWDFTVVEHGINVEADEYWVLGELTASNGIIKTVRQQFGSQKIRRQRSSGTPADIGFDLKGSTTDALKKCAMALGVGLYLSKKTPEQPRGDVRNSYQNNQPRNSVDEAEAALEEYQRSQQAGSVAPAQQAQYGQQAGNNVPICVECGAELKETRFRDGTVWGPDQLAGYGRRKHDRVLCMEHYRLANEARRRAEQGGSYDQPGLPAGNAPAYAQAPVSAGTPAAGDIEDLPF